MDGRTGAVRLRSDRRAIFSHATSLVRFQPLKGVAQFFPNTPTCNWPCPEISFPSLLCILFFSLIRVWTFCFFSFVSMPPVRKPPSFLTVGQNFRDHILLPNDMGFELVFRLLRCPPRSDWLFLPPTVGPFFTVCFLFFSFHFTIVAPPFQIFEDTLPLAHQRPYPEFHLSRRALGPFPIFRWSPLFQTVF